MKYRKEVDGLRALAVVPVVLYHAGFTLFSGGYVGVDVFFVISGYLITTIIVNEMAAGEFSFLGFYERRARRILPAFFFVIVCSIPFSLLLIQPESFVEYSESIVASSVFLSNIFFWSNSIDYWGQPSKFSPLIHTWSLSVEEQFYIFYPLALLAVWRFGTRFLFWLLFIIAILSLALAQSGGNLNFHPPHLNKNLLFFDQPSGAFFFLPTRIWELLVGGLAALYVRGKKISSGKFSEIASLIGLYSIAYSIFVFDDKSGFPGVSALTPVLGTALILIFSNNSNFVGKLLSLKPFVWTGLISYSLYLWHQPLFVFQRLIFYAKPYMDEFIAIAIVLSFIFSYFTWKYVETPIRNKARVGTKKMIFCSLVASLLLIGIGLGGSISDGYLKRLELIKPATAEFINPPKTNNLEACIARKSNVLNGVNSCALGNFSVAPRVLIWGDSHADALYSVMDLKLKELGISGVHVKVEKCGYIPSLANQRDQKACGNAFQNILAYVKSSSISHIVIVLRWDVWLYPYPGVVTHGYDNDEGGVEYLSPHPSLIDSSYESHTRNEKEAAIRELVTKFISTNKKVILSYQIPAVGWDAAKVALSDVIYGQMDQTHSTRYRSFKSRTKYIHELLDSIGDKNNLIRVYPEKFFCNTIVKDRCVYIEKGNPLYYDDDHLSNRGAKKVVDDILGHF